ncbi:hypothetical protein JW948_01800 [bacterium]|nr:hypothetical protein [bacterium]
MKIKEIPLKEIREDFFFCFTAQKPDPKLQASIARSGIRTPVQLAWHEGCYRPLSGFKRLGIARSLNMHAVPAEIADAADLVPVFLGVVEEQRAMRELTVVEKARIAGILERLGAGEEAWNTLSVLLELPDRPDLKELLRSIRDYAPAVQTYLEQYGVSLKKARMFSPLSDEEQEHFIRLAVTLQIRPVELTGIITLLYEIGQREQSPLNRIMEQLGLFRISEDPDLTRNVKTDRIKKAIRERRYPRIGQWQSALHEAGKSMQLPDHAQIEWDDRLEAPGVILKAHIQSREDLTSLQEWLSSESCRKSFDRMLEIV